MAPQHLNFREILLLAAKVHLAKSPTEQVTTTLSSLVWERHSIVGDLREHVMGSTSAVVPDYMMYLACTHLLPQLVSLQRVPTHTDPHDAQSYVSLVKDAARRSRCFWEWRNRC